MNNEQDKIWLLARLSHVLSDEIDYFLERVSVLCGAGMPIKQARPAALILLCDKMSL